jgi:hypothetical protein
MSRHDTTPLHVTATQAGVGACVPAEERAESEICAIELNNDSTSALIAFFKLLDEWDREAKPQ